MSDDELELLSPWNEIVKAEIERRANESNQSYVNCQGAPATEKQSGIFLSYQKIKRLPLKKSTPGENAVNKLFPAALREKLQKNLIKSMPEKNLVLYASPGEKGRKKKVKIVQYPGRAGKGSFYK